MKTERFLYNLLYQRKKEEKKNANCLFEGRHSNNDDIFYLKNTTRKTNFVR